MQKPNWRFWTVVGAVIWLLQFWPGSLGPFIGRPAGQYTPLILGWIPGWFFYGLVMYYVGWVALLLFSFKVLWPAISSNEEEEK